MTQLAPPPQSPKRRTPRSMFVATPWRMLLLGIVIGAIAAGVFGRVLQPQPAASEKAEEAATPEQVTPSASRAVTTITAQPQAIAKSLDAVGSVAAADLISVTSPRTGLQITQLLVEEGEMVQAGQLLAQLDQSTLNAELLQAQAQVSQAQARLAELKAGARTEEIQQAREQINQAKASLERSRVDLTLAEQRLKRNQDLYKEGAIAADNLDETRNRRDAAAASVSQNQANLREAEQRLKEIQRGTRPETLAQATAQLQQAQAQVKLVQTRLQETRIVAPRAGKVIEKLAQVGDLTAPSQPLFTLMEAGQLELQAKIPETQLTQVQVGQAVTITADSNPNLKLTGKIQEIVPTVDQQSRQATLKIALPSDQNLKPGMLLRAQIITNQAQGFAVPTEAVLPQDGDRATLFRLNADNTVTALEVQLGELLSNDQVEILTGLNAGDRLAVKGAAYLKDGDQVTVSN